MSIHEAAEMVFVVLFILPTIIGVMATESDPSKISIETAKKLFIGVLIWAQALYSSALVWLVTL